MQVTSPRLYTTAHLAPMFDRIVGEYWINEAFSLGFTHRWRKKAAQRLALQPGQVVADLMCGTGENWRHLAQQVGTEGSILALDFSPGMLKKARQHATRFPAHSVRISQQNVLNSNLASNSLDAVICSFGLKTLDLPKTILLIQEIKRILKPGGRFALLELTLPQRTLPRKIHQFHFRAFMKPAANWLRLNQEPLEMLETYLARFDPPEKIAALIREQGLEVEAESMMCGFSHLFTGSKSAD